MNKYSFNLEPNIKKTHQKLTDVGVLFETGTSYNASNKLQTHFYQNELSEAVYARSHP